MLFMTVRNNLQLHIAPKAPGIRSLCCRNASNIGGYAVKKRLLYFILPIITLILEILPYGAVLNFMRPASSEDGSPGHFRELYSYFDLMPFGYANFAPLLTAFVTCGILVLLVVYWFTNKTRILTVTKVLVCIGFILSLCPLLYGIRFFSVVGALISVSLIAEWVLLLAAANPRDNESLQ